VNILQVSNNNLVLEQNKIANTILTDKHLKTRNI